MDLGERFTFENFMEGAFQVKALPPQQARIIIVALCIKSCKKLELNQCKIVNRFYDRRYTMSIELKENIKGLFLKLEQLRGYL
jgi:hypothetical protein